MDVIIRGVSPKVYREFKSRAAKLGLRLREALQQAMENWAERGPGPTSVVVDINNEAYMRLKPELLKKYSGKHVAIANGELVAIANSLEELGTKLRELKIVRALGVHVGHEESGEAGEWLWGSIASENAGTTTRQ